METRMSFAKHGSETLECFEAYHSQYINLARKISSEYPNQLFGPEDRAEEAIEDTFEKVRAAYKPEAGSLKSYVGRCLHNHIVTFRRDDRLLSQEGTFGKEGESPVNIIERCPAGPLADAEDGEQGGEGCADELGGFPTLGAWDFEIQTFFSYDDAWACMLESLKKAFRALTSEQQSILAHRKVVRAHSGRLHIPSVELSDAELAEALHMSPNGLRVKRSELKSKLFAGMHHEFLKIYQGDCPEKNFQIVTKSFTSGNAQKKAERRASRARV